MNTVCDLRGASLSTDVSGFPDPQIDLEVDPSLPTAQLVLAGGCFWCTEAVYRQLDGVLDVVSGYAGGSPETANYKDVCSGATDHAEAIAIEYQPAKISFGQLLKVFLSAAHDPTQLNRQGNDQGRQYRSAIFYADDDQRDVASAYLDQLEDEAAFSSPIVTTLERLTVFYPAEAYHQDYAARNPAQSYIAAVSAPKVAKIRKLYPGRLKPASS
ncbi:MAG: peptide-methionine (S)-S-oxide reductase MsrA [Pseudomarimonas sp.]